MFTLNQIVPWGRSFEEYRRMFALSAADLQRTILGCGDGPAGFNAEATRRGAAVVSCDPIYRFDAEQIAARIGETAGQIEEQVRQNVDEFVWDAIPSVDELVRVRMAAMQECVEDFASGRTQGRYVDAELPILPFADRAFDLGLCSHFLFLYSAHLDAAFHCAAVREMSRIASEVRIFPLLTLDGRRSPHVDEVIEDLERLHVTVTIERVPYEFQRGGNEMLRALGE